MGLIYTAEFDVTLTAAGGDTTLWEIDSGSDPVKLLGMSFNVTSEIAEAQEEWLRLRIIRYFGGTFTSSNGSAVTPQPQEEINTIAFGGTVEANGTTIASTTGTTDNLETFGFNVRQGYGPFFYPPEFRHRIRGVAQSAMVINLLTAVADDVTLTSTLWLEEG